MSTVEQDKEKIAKMPRKEANAEILHCWREQEQLVHEIATLKSQNLCDICAGTGTPASKLPCMCKGTGLMSVAAAHFRELLYKTEKENKTLQGALKEACYYLRQADELIQDSNMIEPEDEEPGYLPSVIEWEKLCS